MSRAVTANCPGCSWTAERWRVDRDQRLRRKVYASAWRLLSAAIVPV